MSDIGEISVSQALDKLNKAIIDFNGANLDEINGLIQQVADINSCDAQDQLAVNLAAFHGHRDVLELLIDAGADVTTCASYQGYFPLHCAAKSGHLPVIELLLKRGVDVNCLVAEVEDNGHHSRIGSLENQVGSTPLHFAARMGKDKVVAYLLDHGANINAHETDTGNTPLHEAVLGWSAMVRVPNQERRYKLRRNYLNVIATLVGGGADLTLADENAVTPKMLADTESEETDEEQITLLLAALTSSRPDK